MLVGNNKRTERVDPMPIEDNIEEEDDDDDRGDHDGDSRTSSVSESPVKKKRRHNKESEKEDEKEGYNDMDNKNAAAAASSFVTAACAVDRDEKNDNDEGETANDDNENENDAVSIQAKTKQRNNKKKRIFVPWDDMFERLAAYKKEHNTANVPNGYTLDKKPATWLTTQRTSYKNKELSTDQIHRLELIGFVWKFVHQNTWEESFQQLVAHYNSQPPQQDESMNVKARTALGSWVKRQRKSYEKETLSTERIKRLEAIGFVWVVETLDYDEMWTAMFEKYLAHQKENTTSSVPKKADRSLAGWMTCQRSYYKNKHKRLSVDRIHRLQSAGFELDLQQNKRQQKKLSIDPLNRRELEFDLLWDTAFQQLITYKDEHKGCVNVPKRGADAKLGRWVVTQRQRYRKEKLAPDRITQLESIGFVWDFKDDVDKNWMEMYHKLLLYKQEHKDCKVPRKYNNDLKLGGWVTSKRRHYNYNNTGRYKLSPKHLQLLNDINFFDNSPIVCI